jgi:hypothetical protein
MMRAELVSRGGDEQAQVVAMAEAARCLVLLERELPRAEAMALEASARSGRAGGMRPPPSPTPRACSGSTRPARPGRRALRAGRLEAGEPATHGRAPGARALCGPPPAAEIVGRGVAARLGARRAGRQAPPGQRGALRQGPRRPEPPRPRRGRGRACPRGGDRGAARRGRESPPRLHAHARGAGRPRARRRPARAGPHRRGAPDGCGGGAAHRRAAGHGDARAGLPGDRERGGGPGDRPRARRGGVRRGGRARAPGARGAAAGRGGAVARGPARRPGREAGREHRSRREAFPSRSPSRTSRRSRTAGRGASRRTACAS